MSEHQATVRWEFRGDDFPGRRYSREHTWSFDGGAVVAASASPAVVPAPWSNPAGVDPEEAFVASIASCHMLWFLHVAADAGFRVERYEDPAVGVMAANDRGLSWVSVVTLRPRVHWGGGLVPSPAEHLALHHRAHAQCFIANSVKTEIVLEPLI